VGEQPASGRRGWELTQSISGPASSDLSEQVLGLWSSRRRHGDQCYRHGRLHRTGPGWGGTRLACTAGRTSPPMLPVPAGFGPSCWLGPIGVWHPILSEPSLALPTGAAVGELGGQAPGKILTRAATRDARTTQDG